MHQHHIEHGSHADREDRVLFCEVKAGDEQYRGDQLEVLLQAAGRDRFQAVHNQHRHDGEGRPARAVVDRFYSPTGKTMLWPIVFTENQKNYVISITFYWR